MSFQETCTDILEAFVDVILLPYYWIKHELSKYQWYRRWHGGVWFYVHVEYFYANMWLTAPDDAQDDYREPLWRGTPRIERWNKNSTFSKECTNFDVR